MSAKRPFRTMILAVGLALLVAGGFFLGVFLGEQASSAPSDEAVANLHEPRAAVEAAALGGAQNAEPPYSAVATRSWDDASLPLSEQMSLMADAAVAGDPAAGCRALSILRHCVYARRHLALLERRLSWGVAPGGEPNEDAVDAAAREMERIAAQIDACAGVDPARLPSADALLRPGLAALTPRQKLLLTLMRPDGRLLRLRSQREFRFQPDGYIYPAFLAEHALDFLQTGFEAVEPLALEGLILLYAPGVAIRPLGAYPALPNPARFLRYVLLQERVFGRDSLGDTTILLRDQALLALDAAQRAEAEAWVAVEAQRWQAAAVRFRATHEADTELDDPLSMERCRG